jgi:hypothetical protein
MRPSCLDGAVRRGRQRPRPKLRQARPALGLLGPSGSRAHATGPEGRSAPLARSPPASPSRAPGPLLHAHRLGLYASVAARPPGRPLAIAWLRARAAAAPASRPCTYAGEPERRPRRSCALELGPRPRRRAGVVPSSGLCLHRGRAGEPEWRPRRGCALELGPRARRWRPCHALHQGPRMAYPRVPPGPAHTPPGEPRPCHRGWKGHARATGNHGPVPIGRRHQESDF